jgi:hypothetical protein
MLVGVVCAENESSVTPTASGTASPRWPEPLRVWFFLFAAWVYDAPNQTVRWRRVGGLATIDIALLVVFGVALGWL